MIGENLSQEGLKAAMTLLQKRQFTFRMTRSSDNSKGKPMDNLLLESFENVCEWLKTKGDYDLHTLKELQQKMKDINGKDS